MAPAAAPQYVVSVVIENPQGAHFGGVIAAPVFKKVMSFVLQEKGIAPAPSTTVPYPLNQAQLDKLATVPISAPAVPKKVVKP